FGIRERAIRRPPSTSSARPPMMCATKGTRRRRAHRAMAGPSGNQCTTMTMVGRSVLPTHQKRTRRVRSFDTRPRGHHRGGLTILVLGPKDTSARSRMMMTSLTSGIAAKGARYARSIGGGTFVETATRIPISVRLVTSQLGIFTHVLVAIDSHHLPRPHATRFLERRDSATAGSSNALGHAQRSGARERARSGQKPACVPVFPTDTLRPHSPTNA